MFLIDGEGDEDDDMPPPSRNADPFCNKSCEIMPPLADGGLINLPADLLV